MKSSHKYLYILAAVVILSCLQSCQQHEETIISKNTVLQDKNHENVSDTSSVHVASQPFQDFANVRQPDKRVRARKGHALWIETEGLCLAATDTAVIRSDTYSVTSLFPEELPPLPQGMMNMTAATAGYRLLPGGEHFLPYAELRMTYDPERIPEGYSPEDIYTSFYDTATLAWVRLERVEVDTLHHEIVSLTTHFTDFINELLKSPEMPETQAFVPTAMTDLEAVSPMDALPLITAPEANNEGTANLSYPIQVPGGRAGMQPNLSVNYSSTGGNSWLGVGWDLSMPSITLDTRWGVPRYDATYETEIYMLAGEQLVNRNSNGEMLPMPHRTNHQTLRSTLGDSARFYARTGDAHDSIIRHNTSTTNYWWEVVDRNGITHLYGHYSDSSLNTSAHPTTLKDDHGNIAKWMLAESHDPYGNWVRYYYDVVTTSGSVPGRQIYPEHIEYTGNNNTPGKYKVLFRRRDRDPRDIPVSCNLGFKEVTDQELCYIRIFIDTGAYSEPFTGRGYYFEKELKYESNFKTRLKAIYMTSHDCGALMKWCEYSQLPGEGYYASRQEFTYYDAPAPDHLFSSNQYVSNLEDADDDISAFMFRPGFRLDDVTSSTALGLSHSSNWSVGGTVGVGLDPNVAMTTFSIGGNFNWSESASESLMSLVDLDGDGLADKVFVKNGTLHWRKQEQPVNGIISFGGDSEITGPSHFLIENGKTSTWGAQANIAVASGSGNWPGTTSTTSTYFSDVDGDGLTDLIHDGEVYFNRLNEYNEPVFSRYSEPAHEEWEEEEPEPEQQVSLCDSIIFDGEVDTAMACDRIWLIEKHPEIMDSASAVEYVNNYQGDEDHVAVIERDSLGNFYVVRYEAVMDCSRRNLAGRGVPHTESVRVWVAPGPGYVDIDAYVTLVADENASRSRHSDGITYVIQHSRGVNQVGPLLLNYFNDVILDTIYICNSCRDEMRDKHLSSIPVQRGDVFFFRLQSMDDKQFDNVEDYVDIKYNNHWYSSIPSFMLTDEKYFQAPYNGHYSIEWVDSNASSDLTPVIVRDHAGTAPIGYLPQDGTLQLVVHSNGVNANWDYTDTRVKIQFWGSNPNPSDTITFWTVGKKEVQHPTGSIWGDATYQSLFGPLYNGWGQFTYHPLIPSLQQIPLTMLIVPSRLRIGSMSTSEQNDLQNQINSPLSGNGFNVSSIDEFENNQANGSLFNPLSGSTFWVEMNADAEHNRWVAFGGHNSIGRDTMSNTMQKGWYNAAAAVSAANGVDLPPTTYFDDAVPPASADGTPAKAILKVNESSNQTYTGGVAMVNMSHSEGKSNIETDYLDMNGDRYPDIVGNGYVQYRQQWGGLGTRKSMPYGINDVTMSVTNTEGAGFGASPASQKRTPSAQPAKAKFTISGDGSSINGDLTIGWDHAARSWTDMNGDGLPDFVSNEGEVRLNTGYTFMGNEDWHFSADHAIHSGMSASGSASVGIPIANMAQGSIQLGGGLSRSVNRTDHTLMDVNGDGLPDLLWRNVLDFGEINSLSDLFDPMDYIHVKFNLGNGKWSNIYNLNIKNFNWSESYNESLNAGITAGFTFFGIFKVTVGVNGTPYSSGTNRDRMQLVDVNGDGLPDLVTSDREDRMTVRYNMAGKTNLLRKVTNFTGSSVTLSYHLSDPGYMQPSRSWLLDTVTSIDPLNPNGGDIAISVYEYENPSYNRFERMSFGYGTVISKQIEPSNNSVYRKVRRTYLNSNILTKGRIKQELTSDGSDNKYIEKEYFYDYTSYDGNEVDTCTGNAYMTGDRVVTRFYEGAATPKLTTAETRQYDAYHNVVTYFDEGDTAYSNDGVRVDITYYTGQQHNLIGLRKEYRVYPTGSSTAQRQARFQYNSEGKLTKQTLGNGSNAPVYDFSYDAVYGNMIQARQPENHNYQRMTYDYTYDPFVNTYPVSITNSHGETATTTYDYFFGKPLTVTDPSGNTMKYVYDCLGRIIDVRSPMNSSPTPSVKNFYYTPGCTGYYYYNWYDYHLNNFIYNNYLLSNMQHGRPYSITEHYDDYGHLITRTVVITDGFGRVLQTKKGLTSNGTLSMQVSGRAKVDHFGRTTRQYDNFTVADTTLTSLGVFEPYIDSTATVTRYDILDRQTRVDQLLGVTTQYYYNVANDATNHRRFYTEVTDPNGNITKQYTDYDGRQVQVTDANGGITLMHYDNLGQLVSTSDPEGFSTSYFYDLLGRMTKRIHPDAGETRYTYDPAGNLVEENNPLGQIYYDYTYYRPVHRRYSYMTGNDVTYTYGTSGTETGRPVRIVDGSGMYECKYDALGNVTDETRTIALPQHGEVYQFRMLYQYDSWGRMLTMTYPDNEEITYTYQWGGDLYAMDGIKNGDARTYIKGISYNMYGQKEHIDYGNTTSAHYTYDALHRLVNLKSRDYSGALMQDIDYTFDNASNVTRIVNNAGVVNTLGGAYENTYNYDVLHRLVDSYGGGAIGNYNTYLTYSPSGRLIGKFRDNNSVTLSATVDMAYGYCNDYQPHAVKRMFDYNSGMLYDMRWDKAGNLGQVSMARLDEMFEAGRFLFWTEDNRMHAAVDDKHYSYYAYDHSGERRLKLTGDNKLLDVNADFMATYTILNEPTLYPSAYMVLTNKGYTKHYYAGTERVAARLGGGGLDALYHVIGNDEELQAKTDMLFKQSLEQVNHRVLNENNLDCIMQNEFAKEEFGYWIDGIPYQMKADVEIDHGQFKDMVNSMLTDYHNGEENEVYFYHSDHLGSASWITDFSGMAVQHLQYLPYGEPYVNQHPFGYSERFTFTGKERDEETGFGYFGARYMDHELMTMWLSVDPMADKYPSISPYAYCAWNPVKLVDPDGEEISPIYDKWGNLLGTDDQGLKGKAIVMDEGNFSQGMSHKDALHHNQGKEGFQDEIAYEKFSRHYAGLKDRPDYDGILSLPEANDWYRNGNGEPLYVDASKISLYPVTTSSFDKGEGCSITPNFLGEYMNYETGPVYGHIQLTLLNESTGEVRLGDSQGLLDNYGFEQQPKGGKWRNFATKIGKALAGNGRPYDIYTYKTGTVRRPYDIYDIIGTVKHKK